jgi:lysozyme
VSAEGIQFVSDHEGFVPRLYDDQCVPARRCGRGHCTVGVGHLVHRGPCDGRASEAPFADGISRARAHQLLGDDLNVAVATVRERVTVPVSQHQFDALVSFVFNVGVTAFANSTLLSRLNAGRYDAVPTEMNRWVFASGKKLRGLVTRRRDEGRLFADGVY